MIFFILLFAFIHPSYTPKKNKHQNTRHMSSGDNNSSKMWSRMASKVIKSRYTVAALAVLAFIVFFIPLGIKPVDDDPDHVKSVDDAKKTLKSVRSARISVAVLGCLFVLIPLFVRGFYDFMFGCKNESGGGKDEDD